MNNIIFTFWEGTMPDYIKLCMKTWNFDYTVLNYENIEKYTIKIPEKVKQLTLPKIADYIRVHVLRDNGGYWLDSDTIMVNNILPEETILGNNDTRSNSIGYLNAQKPHNEMFENWANYQDTIINGLPILNTDNTIWSIMGNDFTNKYLKDNTDIKIGSIKDKFPETYIITENIPRKDKYQKFYFESDYKLKDIKNTDLLMLHNSWTPDWYKKLSENEVLNTNCTLSNILKEKLNEYNK